MENKKSTSKSKVLLIVGLVVVVVLGGLGYSWYSDRVNYVTTDNAKVSGDIVNASPKVSGKVAEIKATTGAKVKKGDVLFTLETDQAQAQLNQAQAALDVAKAQLDKAAGGARSEEVAAAQAMVDQASASFSGASTSKTNLQNSLNDAQSKYNDLLSQMSAFKDPSTGGYDASYAIGQLDLALKAGAIKDAQYTTKVQAVEQLFAAKQQLETQISQLQGQVKTMDSQISAAKAGVNAANSKLTLTNAGASNKDMAILEDSIKVAQANYDLVKLNLDNTVVKAPMDGTIVQVNVHVGDSVAPGQGAVSMVDFSTLQVTAYVLENDLEKVKVDQNVKLSVDAFPGVTFNGKVKEVGLATASVFSLFSTDNASGNFTKVSQRVPVKVDFNAANQVVIPGMSVTAKIKITK